MAKTPTALTIAGSDSGGGAGIQADLKTFSALGVFGASAITAVTAQNTVGVQAVENLPVDMLRCQIQSVLSDIGADAIKIGMLGTTEATKAVTDEIKGYEGPIVLDPVMIAKSGDALLAEDAIVALKKHLLPRATVLTPNLPEAARLLGVEAAASESDMENQGRALLQLGAEAVLMKGGHSDGDICTDLLVTRGRIAKFSSKRIRTQNTHGTGCTISSAIAAGLAKGKSLEAAVGHAHDWLHQAIRHADALGIGAGHGPVHHFHEFYG